MRTHPRPSLGPAAPGVCGEGEKRRTKIHIYRGRSNRRSRATGSVQHEAFPPWEDGRLVCGCVFTNTKKGHPDAAQGAPTRQSKKLAGYQRVPTVKSMMLSGCVILLGTAFPGLRRRA